MVRTVGAIVRPPSSTTQCRVRSDGFETKAGSQISRGRVLPQQHAHLCVSYGIAILQLLHVHQLCWRFSLFPCTSAAVYQRLTQKAEKSFTTMTTSCSPSFLRMLEDCSNNFYKDEGGKSNFLTVSNLPFVAFFGLNGRQFLDVCWRFPRSVRACYC